jgi:hypothetical protein
MPESRTPSTSAQVASLDDLTASLLTDPAALPPKVLDWLSDPRLSCAGPPYSGEWNNLPPAPEPVPSRRIGMIRTVGEVTALLNRRCREAGAQPGFIVGEPIQAVGPPECHRRRWEPGWFVDGR